jgi:phage terminase small subunit
LEQVKRIFTCSVFCIVYWIDVPTCSNLFQSKMNLSEQQRLFLTYYQDGLGVEEAALSAGYSEGTAKKQGERLLRHPRVAEALGKRTIRQDIVTYTSDNEGSIEPISNADWIAVRLESIADFSIKRVAEVVDGEVVFKPLSEWDDGSARALQSVKSTIATKPDGTRLQQIEYKFESKTDALQKLGQYHGMWAGFDQLVAGLKGYGIELVRDGNEFQIKKSGVT